MSRCRARPLSAARAFERGVGAVAFVLGQRDVLFATTPVSLSSTYFQRRQRDDLGVEAARRLRGGGALLALQRVLVLRFARDLVLLGDVVGGLEHRHVEVGLVPQQPLLGEAVHVQLVLHQADRLDAAGDDDRHAVDDDALARRSRSPAGPDAQKRLTVVPGDA